MKLILVKSRYWLARKDSNQRKLLINLLIIVLKQVWMVPEARIELARGLTSTDFKSVASTNSATRANHVSK